MASRPRRNVKSSAQRNKASSSRQREPTPTPSPPSSPENMEFDSTKFLCHEAAEIYKKIHVKSVVRERGFECTPPVHQVNNLYEDIRAEIKRRDWETLCCGDFVGPANCSLMFEFYANVSFPDEQENVYLRGKWIPFGLAYINNMFGTMHLHEDSDSYHKLINTRRLDYVKIAETLSMPGARFVYVHGEPKYMHRWQLNKVARAWIYFISARLLPTTHLSSIDLNRCLLAFVIMKKWDLDVGKVVYDNIMNIAQFKTTGGPAHGSLITAMAMKYGIDTYENDVIRKPMGNITRTHFYDFDAPSLEQPTHEPGVKRQRGQSSTTQDEAAEEDEPINEAPMQLEPPIDRWTQATHDRLDNLFRQNEYMIRQNAYIIQTNREQAENYNAYFAAQNEYSHRQVNELNAAFGRIDLEEFDGTYFTPPPTWEPYQPPPPPPPY